MMRRALLLFAILVCAVAIPNGNVLAFQQTQSIPAGMDTMPPKVTQTAVGCGFVEYEATELFNVPNPPKKPPLPTNQVDRGIASITMSATPNSVNARLVLVTAQSFPPDSLSWKQFIFRVEAIDKTKRATAFVSVRDWNAPTANVTSVEVIIEPSIPTLSDNSVTLTARANNTVTYTVTVRNSTTAPIVVNAIELTGSALFTLTSGGGTNITLAPGETRQVVVSYTPNLQSEAGDNASLSIRTNCGDIAIPVKGTGTLANLSTENWDAGNIMKGVKVCKSLGFKITNNGSATATISAINVTLGAPELTLAGPTPAVPFDIPAGGSVDVTDLCFTPATESGVFVGAVTLTTNAETGDFVADVTANRAVNSVDPVILQRLNVRFDASGNVIRYDSEASALLFDVRGTVVGNAAENARKIDAQSFSAGTYFLVINEKPAVSIPVSIVR
ncbi:MAG: hypothetical protein HYX66_07945 [Ignavibacteria bacterium]|nr:hypothetical protein [Ignavibacteria bacterium]